MPPENLPAIETLRRRAQALAMLDAILSPEWQYRYYSYNRHWAPGAEMGSMRNGSGDDWFLLFDAHGAALKGFAHERAGDDALAEAIQSQVPAAFAAFLHEPAFSMEDATFCFWRGIHDTRWQKVDGGPEPDGSDDMLALLLEPAGYREWAEDYYEIAVPAEAVASILAYEPLRESVVRALDPAADMEAIRADAEEIGYPLRS